MSAELVDCFKYASKENIVSVIEDLSDDGSSFSQKPRH